MVIGKGTELDHGVMLPQAISRCQNQMNRLLTGGHFNVDDGETAPDFLSDAPCDAISLELMLPGVNGQDVWTRSARNTGSAQCRHWSCSAKPTTSP